MGASAMSKIGFLLTLFVALVSLLPAAPAQAQAARTFVSAAGSDSNTCTNVATPCRHLATAYAATSANGEIDVLDPANYGALTITGPVSIEGHGWAAISAASGNQAITINANTGDKINIIGVVLDGTAIANTTGIQFNSGGTLIVRDSVIRNFGNVGIVFQPNSSGQSQLFVLNTLVSDNTGDGIEISPSGSGTTIAVLDHVEMENNEASGVEAVLSAQTVNVTVSDSVSANNVIGIAANVPIVSQRSNAAAGGSVVSIMVRNSTIANNSLLGLLANSGTVLVTRSTITGNNTAWSAINGGVVSSYADNNIDGNTSANTEPPNPLPYK
jgi:hypothetical protein